MGRSFTSQFSLKGISGRGFKGLPRIEIGAMYAKLNRFSIAAES